MAKGHKYSKLPKKISEDLRKRWVILLICVAAVAASHITLTQHYLSFRPDEIHTDLVYRVESKLLDLRFKLRELRRPKSKVGVLAIDERTLQEFGRWPFSRRFYGQAFDNLKKAGVRWIGFDSIYSEAEKTLLEEANKELATGKISNARLHELLNTSPADKNFAEGVKRFENIVLGYFFFGSQGEAEQALGKGQRFAGKEAVIPNEVGAILPDGFVLDKYELKKAYGAVFNIPEIGAASSHAAFFNNDADDDAINRWGLLVTNVDGHLLPSLALKTAAESMNRDIMVFFNEVAIESIALVNRKDESDAIEIPVDPSGVGRMLINHRGPGETFPYFSLVDAYNNKFTKKQREQLKGAVLLMGATATGIGDLRPNPFDPAIAGVENHAAMMDNIITKDFLKRPTSIYKTELLIVLLIGIIFAPLMIWGNSFVSGLTVLVALVAYYYIDRYYWFGRGVWTYMAIPSLEMIGMFVGATLWKYMTEEAERKKVRGAFQFYLSPEVIDQVLENPDALRLGGERKELTVFFSDVRSFTTISESLTPEKLCELMNDYFTPMTSIILRSSGVLDKYIGDAIMAFWGAPLALPNHADTAAQASIEMLFALEKLREDFPKKGFPVIDIGIGLNTGTMSVGNMGSGERFCYTVMGDSVNLGSRLEGLTKEYGIHVMISEYTKAKLTPNRFFLRDLDDIRVKGKNEPVNVHQLMRPDFLRQESEIREFIGLFEEGRRLYKRQDWQKAKARFFDCLRLKPDDKSAALYIERIEEYSRHAPTEDWDGVYTFKHK